VIKSVAELSENIPRTSELYSYFRIYITFRGLLKDCLENMEAVHDMILDTFNDDPEVGIEDICADYDKEDITNALYKYGECLSELLKSMK